MDTTPVQTFTRDQLLSRYIDLRYVPAGTLERHPDSPSVITEHCGDGWTRPYVVTEGETVTADSLAKHLQPIDEPKASRPDLPPIEVHCDAAAELAHYLRAARKASGKSLEATAARCSMGRRTIQRLEAPGTVYGVRLRNLVAVLEVYNLDIKIRNARFSENMLYLGRERAVCARYLRKVRKSMGLTQAQAAARADIQRETVVQIEREDMQVSFTSFLKLCRALGLPVTIEPIAPLTPEGMQRMLERIGRSAQSEEEKEAERLQTEIELAHEQYLTDRIARHKDEQDILSIL